MRITLNFYSSWLRPLMMNTLPDSALLCFNAYYTAWRILVEEVLLLNLRSFAYIDQNGTYSSSTSKICNRLSLHSEMRPSCSLWNGGSTWEAAPSSQYTSLWTSVLMRNSCRPSSNASNIILAFFLSFTERLTNSRIR